MQSSRRAVLLAGASALSATGLRVHAQGFPSKPLRWVVGYPAGSGLDFVARVVSETMSKYLGREIIVENKAGAAGSISAAALLAAPADGHTLLSADVGIYALNPHLYKNLQYDGPRDFRVVGMMVNIPMALFVPAALPVDDPVGFVRYVKNQPPGSVNYASSGVGNPTHLTMALFERAAGLRMTHVPYKGSPAALTDVVAGVTSAFFVGPNDGIQYVKSGRLKIIGTATPARLPVLPKVPTLAESGFDVSFPVWLSMVVASRTPEATVERLHEALAATMRMPDVMRRLEEAGYQISPDMSSAQADAHAKAEYTRWAELLPRLNVKLD